MSLKRRQFTKEFKVQVLRELEAGKPLVQAAREYQVHPTMLHAWRRQFESYGEKAFAGNGHAYTEQARIAELERLVGQQALEIAFLKRALTQLEAHQVLARSASRNGGSR